jgi:ketosteroid isomerase-like protein
MSCRSTKKIGTALAKKDTSQTVVVTDAARRDSIAFIRNTLQALSANQVDFTTFSAKVNIDYRDAANKNYDVNAIVRMYKDSAIWISANAILGIEAMRALITKDSVKIINKLDKTYTARSVDYLQEVTSLPLDLRTIQNLIIGNPVFLDSNVVSYSRSENIIALSSLGPWFKNLLTLSESDKLLQSSKLDDVDMTRSRTADLTYSDYENKKGFPFATKRRMLISEKKKLEIKLDFKQYDKDGEVNLSFPIPKNYERN